MPKVKRFLYSSDWHVPYMDEGFEDWLVKQCEEYRPDVFVAGGDQLDLVTMSKYKDNAEDGTDLADDYEELNRVLARVRKAVPKKCDLRFLWGNHEDRIEQGWVSKNLRKALHWNSHCNGFLPEIKNWKQHPYAVWNKNNRHRLGQVTFIHGWETSKAGIFKQAVEQSVENGLVISGHIHRGDEHIIQLEVGDCTLPYYRVSCGMGLAYKNAGYMRAKRQLMVNWTQGIVVGEALETKSPRRTREWSAHPEFYSAAHRANRCGINNRAA